MKRTIISIFVIILIILFGLSTNIYAAALTTISVDTDKTTVNPGEEITITVDFGQDMGAYTVDVAYDANLFEYVSATGGTASDLGNAVRVLFYDATVGSNPSSRMTVTFRAKTTITTSNPTNFAVTAEGLANPDASVTYDDITVPITKNVMAEPAYQNYVFGLQYTGDIIKGEEKNMNLSYSSPVGRYYDHVRIVLEVTGPTGSTVNLLGTDASLLEHDLVQNGWGDASGFGIGGNVNETLALRGTFSEAGDYTITVNLIDRDNSDAVVATNTFSLTVRGEAVVEEENNVIENITTENVTNTTTPEKLPQTGKAIFTSVAIIIVLAFAGYMYVATAKKGKH